MIVYAVLHFNIMTIFRGYLFLFLLSLVFVNKASAQQDTSIFYFRYDRLNSNSHRVKTKDSADFIRMITPADAGEENFNVKEFYKDGRPKLIGKYDSEYYKETKLWRPIGNFITFFPNGKRKSFENYTEGHEDGDEYLFYPTGKTYCYIKHISEYRRFSVPKTVNWECYDQNGAKICSEGNGHWLLFDEGFKPLLEGNVKNGIFDGVWRGATLKSDSVKFTYLFKDGKVISGVGYDKNGKAYPFINDAEPPRYKTGKNNYYVSIVSFVSIINSHLKPPRDANGNKMLLDTAHIAFTLEKDGSLSDAELIGNTEPEITKALKQVVDKSGYWTPRTYFGLPIRSRITVSYKITGGFQGYDYVRRISWQEKILNYDVINGYRYD